MSKHPSVPKLGIKFLSPVTASARTLNGENNWLKIVSSSLLEETDGNCDISWAAFQANQNSEVEYSTTASRLLPLFHEAAHSVAMIRHAMNVVKSVRNRLNPGKFLC